MPVRNLNENLQKRHGGKRTGTRITADTDTSIRSRRMKAAEASRRSKSQSESQGRLIWVLGVIALVALAVLLGTIILKDEYKNKPANSGESGDGTAGGLEIIAEYPHDPEAFTQGLLFHSDGHLYESTGLYGQSTIRKVNPISGDIIMQQSLDSIYFGEGLELVGDKLIQLTWRRRTAFVYNVTTFDLINSFTFTTNQNEGWGIASNGTHLVVSDGSEYLHIWDINSFTELSRIQVIDSATGNIVRRLNELEFVGNELLANIWYSDRVARIDVEQGLVTGYYDFSDLPYQRKSSEDVLNGIAYSADDHSLYITGKLWSKMFKLKLP